MLDFSDSILSQVIVHFVGNKANEEGVKKSNEVLDLSLDLDETLKRFFFKPFKKNLESYLFSHNADIELNELYHYSKQIFADHTSFKEQSHNILNHLYEQSSHPHIKSGELYIAHIKDVNLDGELINAVGIFKSEVKSTFLKTAEKSTNLDLEKDQGININKLDKGCLIFNTNAEYGYKVFMIDANNYDAQYWKDDFLHIELENNQAFQTRSTIEMLANFTQDVVAKTEDKKDQVMMLNRSVQYFEEKDAFDSTEFAKEVIQDPLIIEEFQQYKPAFEEERGYQTDETFEIVDSAVKQAKKKLKSSIRLDTSIEVKLDFNHPEKSQEFIEKGYDEEKGMYFYLLYFNHEV